VAQDCDDLNPCTTDLCDDVTKQCDYLAIRGCTFNPGTGGASAVDSGTVGTGGTISGGGAGGQNTGGTATGGGTSDIDASSPVDGSAGNVAVGGAAGAGGGAKGGEGGTSGSGNVDGGTTDSGSTVVRPNGPDGGKVFKRSEYGSCTCRLSPSPERGRTPAAVLGVIGLALVAGSRRRRRPRREASIGGAP
jgi:MYXO-CTERM domain-containing protein